MGKQNGMMQKKINNEEECVTEYEVSEMTKLSLATLRNNRWLGVGIPYIKIGRSVRYMKSDVMAELERLRVEPTPHKPQNAERESWKNPN